MQLNPQSSKATLVCAFGLLAAFFMPWFQLVGFGISGYSLAQLGSYGNFAWIVPILAAATIWVSLAGLNNRLLGAITGIVPLVVLLYALMRLAFEAGTESAERLIGTVGHVLSIGAYLTIMFSIAIIVSGAETGEHAGEK